MPARKPDTILDADTAAAVHDQTLSLLSAVPEPFRRGMEDRVAQQVVATYEPPEGRLAEDPEDLTDLLRQSFEALGREVPAEISAKLAAASVPIRDGGVVLRPDQEEERSRLAGARAEDALQRALRAGGSEKRQRYLYALQQSPIVKIYNRKDRFFQINGVRVEVPTGPVEVPVMIAREIEILDHTDQWVAAEEARMQRMGSIEAPRSSFVQKRVAAFSIS